MMCWTLKHFMTDSHCGEPALRAYLPDAHLDAFLINTAIPSGTREDVNAKTSSVALEIEPIISLCGTGQRGYGRTHAALVAVQVAQRSQSLGDVTAAEPPPPPAPLEDPHTQPYGQCCDDCCPQCLHTCLWSCQGMPSAGQLFERHSSAAVAKMRPVHACL